MRIWRRLAFELHGRWPWGIWLLVLAATLWLFDERGRSLHALGMAEVRQIPLSPLSPARIASIEVDLGQLVDAGEVLVRLDTSLLDAEMAIVEAEIRRLDEELSKELLLRTQEQLDQASRLTSTAEQAALELVQAHTRSARNRAELELMEGEITRQEKLVAQQLAPMDLLSELKRQRAALVEDNSGGERSIRLLEQHVADSISRLDRWRSLLSPAAATPPGGRQPRPPSDGQASASAAQAAGALTTYIQPIRAAIEVEGRKLERLKREKDSSLLRAPEPSRVAVVALRPGSLATPGTPVLTLVAETTSRVIAYIGEAKALSVRPGQQAMLVPRDRSGPAYRGRVVSLGPAITEAPSRFRPVFAQPFWSREAVVQIEQGSQAAGAGSVDAPRVLPGQAFEITFLDEVSEAPLPALALGPATGAGTGTGLTSAPRRAEETEPAAEAGSEQAEAPRLLVVPPALHRRSRLEPSGLVWVPELDRYLLVSDDTGWPRADDHAPWVFTVSAAGEVDEEPLVLQGVPQLNDLEDVTSTASGIYLLSSQSLSRHGRRPPSRELLVRASVGPGRRLVATGQVRLLPALLAAAGRAKGRSWRQGLGLDLPVAESSKTGSVATDLPQLDIEGLAAQPDGTLLLGLKEPLSAGGQALLWRLARPEHLLEKGVLEPEDLTLLARLHLQLQLPGAGGDAVLAMGISGLCTLPGGDLVLLSTIPGDGRQPSGAVWRLPASELERARTSGGGPTLHPLLVRSFPGLKPEGAALSPDGWLALTFDRGQDPPLWLRLRP